MAAKKYNATYWLALAARLRGHALKIREEGDAAHAAEFDQTASDIEQGRKIVVEPERAWASGFEKRHGQCEPPDAG